MKLGEEEWTKLDYEIKLGRSLDLYNIGLFIYVWIKGYVRSSIVVKIKCEQQSIKK